MSEIYIPLTSWVISFVSFATFFVILKKWRDDKEALRLGWFWLATAIVWLTTGLSSFMGYMNKLDYSKILAYLSYVFVIISAILLVYCVFLRATGKMWVARFFYGIYILSSSFFVYFLLSGGLLAPNFSEWGVKYGLTSNAFFIFEVELALGFIVALYDALKRIFFWIKNKKLSEGYLLFSSISLIGYLFSGYLDAGRLITGWRLALSRILMTAFILLCFLAYQERPNKKENIYEI